VVEPDGGGEGDQTRESLARHLQETSIGALRFGWPAWMLVIERGDGNFGAWAPDLPGCVAVGDTIEESELECDAIAFHIDGLREEGQPVPEPAVVAAAVVEVA